MRKLNDLFKDIKSSIKNIGRFVKMGIDVVCMFVKVIFLRIVNTYWILTWHSSLEEYVHKYANLSNKLLGQYGIYINPENFL